jgi:TRAP-type C4-dicarboxylate transport system substrate-binding protein
MKKLVIVLSSIAVFILVSLAPVLAPTAVGAEKTWVLRFSTGFSASSHFGKESKWYFDNIAQQSGGRIKVEYHFSGALCKLGEELNAMRARSIDVTCTTPPYFAPLVPLVDALNMNYVTSSVDGHMKAAQEVYDNYAPLRDQFEKNNNAKILWNMPVTNNTLWSTFPVPNIAALKGKKIRALGRTGESISAFGGVPVGIVWGDIYTSAQKGIIQAAYGTPLSLGWDAKFYEVMPYVTQTGSGVFGSQVMMIRKDLYDEFPNDLRKLFHDWARKAEDKSLEIVEEENRSAVDDMESRGIKLMIWSREELAKARDLVQPAQFDGWVKKMGERGLSKEAQTTKDMYIQALQKYEKISKYQESFDYWNQKYKKGF